KAIFGSAKKTNKVIILHEASKTGGIGAEVSALIAEELFDSLDGPIVRIAAPDTPVPFSPPLEEFYMPKAGDVVSAAKRLAAY
ncbi:MAG: transketolase C-terminal domain-containing protein, partial [Nitrospirota bacterium]